MLGPVHQKQGQQLNERCKMFLSRNVSFATKIGWQDQFILLVKAMSAQNVHIVLSCLNNMLSSFRRAATFFVILVFYWIKVQAWELEKVVGEY